MKKLSLMVLAVVLAIPAAMIWSKVSDAAEPAETQTSDRVGEEMAEMNASEMADFADSAKEIREQARARWEKATREEKQEFLDRNPKLRKRVMEQTWESLGPKERAAFLQDHPVLRERLRARWRTMNAEQRQAFLNEHPKLQKKLMKREKRLEKQRIREAKRAEKGKQKGEVKRTRDEKRAEGMNNGTIIRNFPASHSLNFRAMTEDMEK